MGEFEKFVGEHGEKTAASFFDLVGWRPRKEQFDIGCATKDHKNKNHGIDAYFRYKSPLVDEVLDHIVISVKYSSEAYPENPVSKFKEYYLDLLEKVSCFDRSRERSQASRVLGVKRNRTFGLLVWVNDVQDGKDDIVGELQNIRFKEDISALSRPIYIVDRRRFKFIVETIRYVDRKFSEVRKSFAYHHTGSNISALERVTDGDFLPIQLLCSDVIIFRLQNLVTKEIKACICTSDKFSGDGLEKLVGLAQEMTSNYASGAIICFPDYRPEVHKSIVSDVLMTFSNEEFAKSVVVEGFRGLI